MQFGIHSESRRVTESAQDMDHPVLKEGFLTTQGPCQRVSFILKSHVLITMILISCPVVLISYDKDGCGLDQL